ncbi:unnamed protein product [Lactuca virosa]|uniref:Uncharacterized protein n=1 Tax=Lactuca virosa TaxID=75947 RepID=A0AAU9PRH3_9ASTR|nr:unnamed protein product [Lactuca virosa]
MKAECVIVGVEGGRHVVKEQVASEKFDPQEPSVVVELTQVMHVSVKTFMEMDFSSLPHLGDLHLEGLRRLCRDPDAEENTPEGEPLNGGSSSTTLVK